MLKVCGGGGEDGEFLNGIGGGGCVGEGCFCDKVIGAGAKFGVGGERSEEAKGVVWLAGFEEGERGVEGVGWRAVDGSGTAGVFEKFGGGEGLVFAKKGLGFARGGGAVFTVGENECRM